MPLLFQVKLLIPHSTIGMIFHPMEDWKPVTLGIAQPIDLMKISNVQVAHLYPNMLTEESIARVQAAGFKVNASANDQLDEIDRFAQSEVFQLSTNFLDRAIDSRNPS